MRLALRAAALLAAAQLAAVPGARAQDAVLTGTMKAIAERGTIRLGVRAGALPFRRDDPDFAAVVAASFGRMARDGVLAARDRRRFIDRLPDGEELSLPMRAQLTGMHRAMGQSD